MYELFVLLFDNYRTKNLFLVLTNELFKLSALLHSCDNQHCRDRSGRQIPSLQTSRPIGSLLLLNRAHVGIADSP